MKKCIRIILCGILAICFQSIALAAIPQVSRGEILNYAKTAVGSWYKWGGDAWDPNNRSWGGADCSGLVIKAWMIPYKAPYNKSVGHPWSTYSFYHGSTHWNRISRSAIQPGDAYVRRSSKGGHTFIYAGKDNWGKALFYEAPRRGSRIRYGTKTISSSYVAIRRKNLKATSGAPAPNPQPVQPVTTPSSASKVIQVTSSSLNVRTGPSTGYRRIGRIYWGQRYVVVGKSGKWFQIYFGGRTAWCHGGYVQSAVGGQILAINARGLNVRTGPSTGYSRRGVCHRPEVYVITGQRGSWRQIWFDGRARWCYAGKGYGSQSSY